MEPRPHKREGGTRHQGRRRGLGVARCDAGCVGPQMITRLWRAEEDRGECAVAPAPGAGCCRARWWRWTRTRAACSRWPAAIRSRRSQFNRAIQAKRQPGSSFKPFVYAAAMEQVDPVTGAYKWTPSYRVLDIPYVSCDPNQEKCCKPDQLLLNSSTASRRCVSAWRSRATRMTVRLALEIGFDKVSDMGERMGIYDSLPPYESMALGAGDTTLMRMATAYAELVEWRQAGSPGRCSTVSRTAMAETVYRTDQRPCAGCVDGVEVRHAAAGPRRTSASRSWIRSPPIRLVSILEGVVQRGTGTIIRAVGKPVAAKTGTTNDSVRRLDRWASAPTSWSAVWVGFDNPRNMGEGESGGRLAAPIFRDFMLAALKDRPAVTFRIPDGVRAGRSRRRTAGCQPAPDTRLSSPRLSRPGTAPTDTCESSPCRWPDGYRVDLLQDGRRRRASTPTRDGQVDCRSRGRMPSRPAIRSIRTSRSKPVERPIQAQGRVDTGGRHPSRPAHPEVAYSRRSRADR